MNCKDYKEAIAAEPHAVFDGAEHADACADCASFRDEMQALDSKIAAAMAIDVPKLVMPELPAIDTDSNVVGLPYRSKQRRVTPVWFGLAATVLIAAFFGIRYMAADIEYPSLGAEILAHLDHEPNALQISDVAVSERRLAKVVRDDVAALDSDIGLITYARTCVINGKKVPHLVMQGEAGPVTLLLMPDEKILSAVSLEGVGVNGYILPVGDGSIAIIGERGERMQEIEQRVVNSVKWST